MSTKSTHKSYNLSKESQIYNYITRLVSLYTFIGVTYLLFITHNTNHNYGASNIGLKKMYESQNIALISAQTETNINKTIAPTIPSRNSKRRLFSTNTTKRSVKRNYELISNLYTMLPDGMIMIWYGSTSNIPPGWTLCDGTNGTPDLRDKFVIGGGNLYSLDDNGGSTTTTLSIAQLPTHVHAINLGSTTQSDHTHGTGSYSMSTQSDHTHSFSDQSTSNGDHDHGCTASTSNAGSHNHQVSGSTAGSGGHSHSGSTSTSSNHNHNSVGDNGFGVSATFNRLLTTTYMDINLPGININNYGCPDGHAADCSSPKPNVFVSNPMSNAGAHSHSFNTDSVGSHTHSMNFNSQSSGTHSHSASCTVTDIGGLNHFHDVSGTTGSSGSHSHSISGNTGNSGSHSHTISGNTDPIGSGNSMNILNPYYTAYYIMKVAHTFPTDDPTESPTLAPSNAPSLMPSNSPSKAPSLAPSIAPSKSPSLSPLNAPTLTPTIAPSLSPSVAPSLSPSNIPTLVPTQPPSIAPSNAPSYAPTLNPASFPSNAPSLSPTMVPSIMPTISPSITPSISPTMVPSNAPSISPSIMPTISPTIAPSNAPSISPTTPPSMSPSMTPSTAPSIVPSLAPSISPSLTPTAMPTPTCWDGKYKLSMIHSTNLNRNDELLSGESLVSINCRFILTMNIKGNLELNGLVGKYINPFEKDVFGNFLYDDTKMKMYTGWETNTTIKDNSNEAIAIMTLRNGVIIVEEHLYYPIVPKFDPILLWQSDKYINENENELILQLSDNGCLVLYKYYGSTNVENQTPLWFECAVLEKDREVHTKNDITTTMETTVLKNESMITTVSGFGLNILGNDNKNNIKLLTTWNIIISIILILLLLMCLHYCINKIYDNYTSTNIAIESKHNIIKSNQFGGEDLWPENDENDDEMDNAIELWNMEQNYGITANNATDNAQFMQETDEFQM